MKSIRMRRLDDQLSQEEDIPAYHEPVKRAVGKSDPNDDGDGKNNVGQNIKLKGMNNIKRRAGYAILLKV